MPNELASPTSSDRKFTIGGWTFEFAYDIPPPPLDRPRCTGSPLRQPPKPKQKRAPAKQPVQPKRRRASSQKHLKPKQRTPAPKLLRPKRQPPPLQGPLGERLREIVATRWKGMRSAYRNENQARLAVQALQAFAGAGVTAENVTKADLRALVQQWTDKSAKPSTITFRLNCLSMLGVDVKKTRPRQPRTLKWWLNDHDEKLVCAALRSDGAHTVADLVEWTTATGLRIEESLRLTTHDVVRRQPQGDSPPRVLVTVPGTKTDTAQATIVLSARAIEVLDAREVVVRGERIFPIPYLHAQRAWARHRHVFGLTDPKRAQLKALRRSAARYIHGIKGMPLDQLRQYLRHEDVQTTMGYLRLTGGYNEEEQARWL